MQEIKNPWSLNSDYDDPYWYYKDSISHDLEILISVITKELLNSKLNYDSESAKSGAIILMMEQMIKLQREHANLSQQSMVLTLFNEMPELAPARKKAIDAVIDVVESNIKKRTFIQKIKFLFSK